MLKITTPKYLKSVSVCVWVGVGVAVCKLEDKLGQSSESLKSVFKETYFLKSTWPKVPVVGNKKIKKMTIWQY